MPVLDLEYVEGEDASKAFSLERAASLNSPNLIGFLGALSGQPIDMDNLNDLINEEKKYLEKFGFSKAYIEEKTSYYESSGDAPTMEYWPCRIMNAALGKLQKGEAINNVKDDLKKEIDKTREALQKQSEKDAPRDNIVVKTIGANSKESYEVIEALEEIDGKLSMLTEAQRDYIKMTANQAYLSGSLEAARVLGGGEDVIHAGKRFSTHLVTIDQNQEKVFIEESVLYEVKAKMAGSSADLSPKIRDEKFFFNMKRDISAIEYKEVEGVKFLKGVKGESKCIATYLAKEIQPDLDGEMRETEIQDIEVVKDDALNYMNYNHVGAHKSDDFIEGVAESLMEFMNFSAPNIRKDLEKELSQINPEEETKTILQKITAALERFFEAIKTLFSLKEAVKEVNNQSRDQSQIEDLRQNQQGRQENGKGR